jgi:hypothetical protein
MDFYVNIKPQATGLQFINCGFYGSTAWPFADTALVDCTSGVEGLATTNEPWRGIPYFEDCSFKPQRSSYRTDGIIGSFWLVRANICNVRDGARINSTSDSRPSRARIEQSCIHELAHWHPVPGGVVYESHCVNILAGGYVLIQGNTLEGTAHRGDDRNFVDPDAANFAGGDLAHRNPTFKDHLSQANGPHAIGSGLRVRQTRQLPLDGAMEIKRNWFAHGLYGVQLTQGTYIFTENRFRRNGFYLHGSQAVQYYIKLDTSGESTIIGLGNNMFEDNGELLTANNGGIQF